MVDIASILPALPQTPPFASVGTGGDGVEAAFADLLGSVDLTAPPPQAAATAATVLAGNRQDFAGRSGNGDRPNEDPSAASAEILSAVAPTASSVARPAWAREALPTGSDAADVKLAAPAEPVAKAAVTGDAINRSPRSELRTAARAALLAGASPFASVSDPEPADAPAPSPSAAPISATLSTLLPRPPEQPRAKPIRHDRDPQQAPQPSAEDQPEEHIAGDPLELDPVFRSLPEPLADEPTTLPVRSVRVEGTRRAAPPPTPNERVPDASPAEQAPKSQPANGQLVPAAPDAGLPVDSKTAAAPFVERRPTLADTKPPIVIVDVPTPKYPVSRPIHPDGGVGPAKPTPLAATVPSVGTAATPAATSPAHGAVLAETARPHTVAVAQSAIDQPLAVSLAPSSDAPKLRAATDDAVPPSAEAITSPAQVSARANVTLPTEKVSAAKPYVSVDQTPIAAADDQPTDIKAQTVDRDDDEPGEARHNDVSQAPSDSMIVAAPVVPITAPATSAELLLVSSSAKPSLIPPTSRVPEAGGAGAPPPIADSIGLAQVRRADRDSNGESRPSLINSFAGLVPAADGVATKERSGSSPIGDLSIAPRTGSRLDPMAPVAPTNLSAAPGAVEAIVTPDAAPAPTPVEAAPIRVEPRPALRLAGEKTPQTVPLPQAPAPASAVIGVPQSAGRAFAAAIAAAGKPQRRHIEAPEAQEVAPASPVQPTARTAIAERAAPLDVRREDWPQRLIDRIEAARDAADANDTRIRLVPDALGRIDVALRRDGETVHVHFTAESAATRDLLANAQPRLAELADARGLKLGGSAVDGGNAEGQRQRFAAPNPQNGRGVNAPASAFGAEAPGQTDGRIA